MDYNKACNILELNNNFDNETLKKAYRIKALKWHPDKNLDNLEESKNKFNEISEAYNFLNNNNNYNNNNNNNNNYNNILYDFVNNIFSNEKTIKILKLLLSKIGNKLLIDTKLINELDITTTTKLYEFICTYEDILHLDNDSLNEIKKKLKENIENNNIIIIHPNLKNLLNDEVYILQYNEDKYFIPLWHSELTYNINNNDDKNIINNSDNCLQVKCVPIFEDNIKIDSNNNIITNITLNINELLDQEIYNFNLCGKVFEIKISELKIKKYQKYIIYKEGIARINTKDIYNIEIRSNIIIFIEFSN